MDPSYWTLKGAAMLTMLNDWGRQPGAPGHDVFFFFGTLGEYETLKSYETGSCVSLLFGKIGKETTEQRPELLFFDKLPLVLKCQLMECKLLKMWPLRYHIRRIENILTKSFARNFVHRKWRDLKEHRSNDIRNIWSACSTRLAKNQKWPVATWSTQCPSEWSAVCVSEWTRVVGKMLPVQKSSSNVSAPVSLTMTSLVKAHGLKIELDKWIM